MAPECTVQPQGLPLAERFWSKVERVEEGCWEWRAGRHWQGYGQFEYRINGKWRPVQAHRVAWELANGPIPDGLWVLHRCDNPPCCRPDHLFLGTAKDNTADMVAKGRDDGAPRHGEWRARGERAPNAKLTEAAVLSIRERYAAGGISQQSLADEFGVNQTKISAVVRRETWRHV